MVELSCVLHVHSTYSDGTATVPEILAAARAAGADVVGLTDHDTLGAKHDGWEGEHDGVLLVIGMEISPRGGHLLAFGLDAEVTHDGRTEAESCAAVAAAGGFGIAAHPFSLGSRMSTTIGRPHPWPALEDPCLTGVEVWSLTTDLAESWRSPLHAVRSLRRPEAHVDGPLDRQLAAYDALLARRRLVAIGGLDAHQPGLRVRGRVRTIMAHERWFAILRTHVLAEERTVDGVLDALRAGHAFLARVDLGDPHGFRFVATDAGGAHAAMGDDLDGGGPWTLRVDCPSPAELRLVSGGRTVARAEDATTLEHVVEAAGAYRAEAHLDAHGARRAWVLSNPIRLLP